MRSVAFAVVLVGCSAKNDGGAESPSSTSDSTASGATTSGLDTSATTSAVTSSSGSDEAPSTSAADEGSSTGDTSGAGDLTVIAWVEADGSFHVTVANHDGPTCADPRAFPDHNFEQCDLTEELWIFSLTLDAPFDVPGQYETLFMDTQLHSSDSSESPNPGLTCGTLFGANLDAMLALDSLSAQEVAGTVMAPHRPELASLPFAVMRCP